ncbi:nucleoside hydrolase [Acephala macrosclerotiorum]|nr:nucleoside hydrolase [Acephala macrosclerotiorum]
MSATQFLIEQVRKYPGQVSIYAAGALTNVALAVRLDEEFASLAKELVIMGGYVDVYMYQATGTVNQADINSDINLMIDPEASKITLTADFPNIITAGNVANQVISTQEFLDEIYEVKSPYSKFMYEYYAPSFPFWDETTMAILIDPTIATNASTVYLNVDVVYASPSYGNIHVYQSAQMPPNIRNVTYMNTIDTARFKAMIKHAVQYPKSCADL